MMLAPVDAYNVSTCVCVCDRMCVCACDCARLHVCLRPVLACRVCGDLKCCAIMRAKRNEVIWANSCWNQTKRFYPMIIHKMLKFCPDNNQSFYQ